MANKIPIRFAPSNLEDPSDRDLAALDAYKRLPAPDRAVLAILAATGSYRKTAARLGVTHPTIMARVRRIRETIKSQISDIV